MLFCCQLAKFRLDLRQGTAKTSSTVKAVIFLCSKRNQVKESNLTLRRWYIDMQSFLGMTWILEHVADPDTGLGNSAMDYYVPAHVNV
jgi:hypothetical protein